jgi:hypothetical protein
VVNDRADYCAWRLALEALAEALSGAGGTGRRALLARAAASAAASPAEYMRSAPGENSPRGRSLSFSPVHGNKAAAGGSTAMRASAGLARRRLGPPHDRSGHCREGSNRLW